MRSFEQYDEVIMRDPDDGGLTDDELEAWEDEVSEEELEYINRESEECGSR